MARINVNPTRMELKKLKARLKTAQRGHKLLKDKTDEMVRRFSSVLKENKALREQVETEISGVLGQFAAVTGYMDKTELRSLFTMPANSVELECGKRNFMNVSVPELTLTENSTGEKYPYSFVGVTSLADKSVKMLGEAVAKLVRLAEVEKTTMMLADEIEKGKRRVNALEYVLIPDLEETIKYITMKLEENDRSSITRLMKVKTMLENRE